MERSISSLCASLSSVLDHADSSSRELADLVSRRPIHLESGTAAFLQKLNRLAEAANAEVEHLESMVLGAVSFEELLGHCGEALNVYARHHEDIESRLVSFGYEPPKVDSEVQDGDIGKPGDPANGCFSVSSSVLKSSRGRFGNDNDAPFGESLKSLGFSDACLATLSSEGTQVTDYGEKQQELYKNPEIADEGKKVMKEAELIAPQSKSNDQGNSLKEMIRASKEEYEQLPPYMKSLASWEELQEGISKLNSYFGSGEAQGSISLSQDDVGAIGLGRKGRACLLMLLRLNQLTMEAVDGSTFYTLRKNNS